MAALAPTNRNAVTRADVIALGRQAPPWQFLPLGVAALAQVPHDAEVRLLVAAAFSRLGLRTPAAIALAPLLQTPEPPREARALTRVLDRLPDDRITAQSRLATALGNARALRATRPHVAQALADAWPEFVRRVRTETAVRAIDGNIVRFAEPNDDNLPSPDAWRCLGDHKAAAARFIAARPPSCQKSFPAPVVLEGLDPPWLLDGLARSLST
ncbi:MAG: hypothetical protein AAF747_02905, partial [Planctomycetota bacterium]